MSPPRPTSILQRNTEFQRIPLIRLETQLPNAANERLLEPAAQPRYNGFYSSFQTRQGRGGLFYAPLPCQRSSIAPAALPRPDLTPKPLSSNYPGTPATLPCPTCKCAACDDMLHSISFSANQWSKGDGFSRCAQCVHGYMRDRQYAQSSGASARRNNSSQATFDHSELENPFAQGAFRWVARGRYTKGDRAEQACVCKWFKSGSVFEEEFFESDIRAVDKALELINRFNELGIVGKPVKLNIPEVWTYHGATLRNGSKALVEPFIQNYQKFNSNTGWNDDTSPWPQVMQALSHFSYHVSGGQYVLCDLHGGIYQAAVVLTDAVVLSRKREFGVTDLGPEGISSFFSHHVCNNYCRPNWSAPANQRSHFRPVAGTTMVRRGVPTQHTRPASTASYF